MGISFLDPRAPDGASDAVLPHARDYLSIILYGTIFQTVSFGLNHMIRAQGHPKTAMATMLIGAITNIILDPVFIYIFRWGTSGAAFATVLSHFVSFVWVLSFFLRGKSQLKLDLRKFHKIKWSYVLQIISIGFAPFAMQLAGSLQNLVLNQSLATYGGDAAISAMGIVFSVNTIFLMPIFGINQGSQPIIGYNYGAVKYKRVKQAFLYAAAGATFLSTLGFLATRIVPLQLAQLFGRHDAELMELAVQAMRVVMVTFPVIGLQIVGANFFQAIGSRNSRLSVAEPPSFADHPSASILPLSGPEGVFFLSFFGLSRSADYSLDAMAGVWQFDQSELEAVNMVGRTPQPER